MPPTAPPQVWVAGCDEDVPVGLTGVLWPDGTVECRFRLVHEVGSLVASHGEVGVVLTNLDAECTTCSDACAV